MIYVVAQFSLLALLAWPVTADHFSLFTLSLSHYIAFSLILIGALIALLALHANRPGNFNVRPDPKLNASLITSGIYRVIRHPMYCSLFFIGGGLLILQFALYKLLVWGLLLLVLILKARREERALLAYYPQYKHYQQRSKAFIPFIY